MATPTRSTTAPEFTHAALVAPGPAMVEHPEKASMLHVIDEELLAEAIKDCEAIVDDEQAGRSDSWPSTAAIAYWNNAQTLRRFLATPHLLDDPRAT